MVKSNLTTTLSLFTFRKPTCTDKLLLSSFHWFLILDEFYTVHDVLIIMDMEMVLPDKYKYFKTIINMITNIHEV
jgi:hypothetical protein